MHRLLQFTRELFEPEPAAASPGPAAAVKTGIFEEIMPAAKVLRSPIAIESIANSGLAPAAFRHPCASREALLGGVLVAYEFRRSARRSIGFSVGPTGLAVSAPKWVALRDIDQALREKSAWILRKLHETRERHQRVEAARVEWQDGAILPYLGGSLQVLADPALAASALRPAASGGLPALGLAVSHPASPTEIRQAAQAWLMRQARPLFAARLDHFAPHLDVQWRKLSLSSASTRWGSASASGSIRLNWRLLHFKPAVIDYVVVHELSHLRVMDHSPRFWATVRSVMPDYAELRAQLKDETIPRW
ncbi:MAG: SprT family zinc-dependent metalloprotease [Polaromonas sp.]